MADSISLWAGLNQPGDAEDAEDAKANRIALFFFVSSRPLRSPTTPFSRLLQQDCGPRDYRGHGGRPTVHVVPVGSVTGDVGVVVPVNDVVEPRLANGLVAVALVIAPGVFVDAPNPVTPSGPGMLVEPGTVVVIEELADPGEDVLPVGVDTLELIDDETYGVGAVGVNSSEIPLLPSTDPVWMLVIGLQGIDVMLVRPGVGLGGVVPEGGFGGTCANAVDAHTKLIQKNKGRFISNLLYHSAVITRDSCASRQPRKSS